MDSTTISIRLWHRLTGALDMRALETDLEIMNADERGRFERFMFFRDRRDYAAAHALLRRALAESCSIPARSITFEALEGGKPAVAPSHRGVPPVDFNLSHTDGLVACAIGRGADVGIDVEQIGKSSIDQIAGRYFSEDEIMGAEDAPLAHRQIRFTELWTLKEAYLKALGVGLGRPLDSVAFEFDRVRGLQYRLKDGAPSSGWHFALFAVGSGFRLAVAARCKDEQRRCHIACAPDIMNRDEPALLRSSPGITVGSG